MAVARRITRRKRKSRWEPEAAFIARTQKKRPKVTSIVFQRGPLRTQQKAHFRYNESVTLNPSAAGTAAHIFSLNGLYDPDITGTGHQPRGFDELMPLYDHYVVIGTRVTIDFVAPASETVAVIGGAAVRDFTAGDSANGYVEGGVVKYITVGNNNGKANRIVMNINPNQFLGRSKPMSDPNLKGNASANPLEQAYLHVFINAPLITADPGGYSAFVTLEYTAILIEPKVPTQS